MGILVKLDEQRSELQQRIATELQAKAAKQPDPVDLPDGVTDSQYLKGSKKTTSLAAIWIIILVLALAAALWLIITGLAR